MSRSAEVYAQCNSCGRKSPLPGRTIKHARALAKPHGWTLNGDTDTCDACRPKARKAYEIEYWRDSVVHLLRDGFDLTYQHIGEITGLSRQRIHQICQKETTPTTEDWINYTRQLFNVEITVPRIAEPEEVADGDDHG